MSSPKYTEKFKGKFTKIDSKFKAIQNKLRDDFYKTLPNYDDQSSILNSALSYSFCGDGLKIFDTRYIVSENVRKVRCDGYDITSAYPYALTKKYPLSNKIEVIDDQERIAKEWQDGLSIIKVRICGIWKKKLKYKQYNVFLNRHFDGDTFNKIGWITNIGLKCLKKLYEVDIEPLQMVKFTDIGYLSKNTLKVLMDFKKNVKDKYKKEYGDESYEYDQIKTIYNKFCYGYLAIRHGQHHRDNRVIIATFQNAYIMEMMLDTILKNINECVYVNTDGCIYKAGAKFYGEIGNKLGQFKKEFENKKCDIVKVNAYWVYNEDDTIDKQVYILNRYFTKEEVEAYMNGDMVEVKDQRMTKDGKKHSVRVCIEKDISLDNDEYNVF